MIRSGNDRSTALRMLGTLLVSGGLAGVLLTWPLGRDTAPPIAPTSRESSAVPAGASIDRPDARGGIEIVPSDAVGPSGADVPEMVPASGTTAELTTSGAELEADGNDVAEDEAGTDFGEADEAE